MSRVTAIILPTSASSSACHINHYRDNAITYKAQRQKCRELKLANAAITDMQMRQRDVAALDAKYTKELADAKVENTLCVMMLPLVVVGCTSKQSVSQCEATTASGVDNAASPDWQTLPERGLFHPQREADQLCKNNWKEPRSILMSSADRVAHIDGQLMQLL